MTKVILAVPRDGDEAGASVDVSDAEARELIFTGRARLADDADRPSQASA